MTTGESVLIQPTWGGPHLKKNARLGFENGAITVTDRRRRTYRFPLSGEDDAPRRFLYGQWDGQADAALVDGYGRSVVLIDLRAFKDSDLDRWREAIGLEGAEVAAPPPPHPDAVALVDPPYVQVGLSAFGIGAVGFGLRWITGSEFFIFAVTVPALIIATICAVLGKMSTASAAEQAQEAQALKENLEKLHGDNEAWLAEREKRLAAATPHASDDPPPPPDDGESKPAPDGH